MKARTRIRRVWRARELVIVELRQRVDGHVRHTYLAQVPLGADAQISLPTMATLGRRVVAKLQTLGVAEDQAAVVLRAVACSVFTHGWYRLHRLGRPAEDVAAYGKRVFATVEKALEDYRAFP